MALNTAPFALGQQRAVGVVRVSRKGKRTTEKFVSPEDQLRMIRSVCAQQNLQLVQVFDETNVSGYRTKFEKRRGLYPATQMIEDGQAEVVVLAFFDRIARNIIVQVEFLGRVAKAGGQVWAADMGQIRTDSAASTFSMGVLGQVAQLMAESTAEKTFGAKQRAVAAGIPPFAKVPLGYRKDPVTRRVVVEPVEAALVRQMFEQRAERQSYTSIRGWLRTNGVVVSTRCVQETLKNRFYLGEMHFGKLINLNSHEPIVDVALFKSVQDMYVSTGPRSSGSTRLLARQGLVRCGTCGRAMIVGSQVRKRRGQMERYYDYRCQAMSDCAARPAISANMLEAYVVESLHRLELEGRSSLDKTVVDAEQALATAEARLERAVEMFEDLGDGASAKAKLTELRAARDTRARELRELEGNTAVVARRGSSAAAWDSMTVRERRALLSLVFARIEVSRGGRGPEERIALYTR